MSIKFTVINTATGETLRTGVTGTLASANLQAGPGETVIPVGSDPVTEQINPGTGSAAPRPLMNLGGTLTAVNKTTVSSTGLDVIVISNVPVGATYHVEYPPDKGIAPIADGTVNDGVLEFTTTVAGRYFVMLTYQNFRPFEVTFNAN
jgi:hypothetical protein